jgi:hypothetical protein
MEADPSTSPEANAMPPHRMALTPYAITRATSSWPVESLEDAWMCDKIQRPEPCRVCKDGLLEPRGADDKGQVSAPWIYTTTLRFSGDAGSA